MFGITFAIQGSMAKPEVIVNPLSLITPGIFREIFQMTPEDPRVVPRERPDAARQTAPRASSAPARARRAGAAAPAGARGRRRLVGRDQPPPPKKQVASRCAHLATECDHSCYVERR